MRNPYALSFLATLFVTTNLLAQSANHAINQLELEARAFSLSVVEAYFEGDCQNFYDAFSDSIFALDGEGPFFKDEIGQEGICPSLERAVRNKRKTYQDYLDNYQVELLTLQALEEKFNTILSPKLHYRHGDYFFVGIELKENAASQEYFIWDDMFVFMVRKEAQQWVIRAVGG